MRRGSGLKRKERSVVGEKLIYTIGIVLAYLVGRKLPLYGVDCSAYVAKSIDAQSIFQHAINGDLTQTSIFSLGFSPYICASMLRQFFFAGKKQKKKAKVSPRRANDAMLFCMMMIAVVQAVLRAQELTYLANGQPLLVNRGISIVEMITGMMILVWISDRNQKYGIGGRSALIFINVLDGLLATLSAVENTRELGLPLLISFVVLVIFLFMENTEKHIPLQRISIHNIHADKNYLAIKCNPVGIMPLMFATAAFMFPRFVCSILAMMFPTNETILWWNQNMTLTKFLGIGIYIVILFVLTILFAFVMVNPEELSEHLQKSGDSIRGIRAGKETRRYLRKNLIQFSLLSSLVMSFCVGLPMWLQVRGGLSPALSVLPSSVMIATGIWSGLYQEFAALKKFDSYKSFI